VKGLVIASCGAAGLDWERLSLSCYLEAMTAKTGEEAQGSSEPNPRFKRFMAAHGVIRDE
jgi:hypothetical protein